MLFLTARGRAQEITKMQLNEDNFSKQTCHFKLKNLQDIGLYPDIS